MGVGPMGEDMRKAFLIAATMAVVGAGVMARGARSAAPAGQRPADQVPLPHDAYPDQLSLEIWGAA